MPGKQPREGEPPLAREQSVIAAAILRREFDPAANTPISPLRQPSLLAKINAAFVAQGLPPTYSLRKMEDWRANCVYRWKRRRQQEQAQEEQEQAQAQLSAPAPTLAGGAGALPSMLGLAASLSRPPAAAASSSA